MDTDVAVIGGGAAGIAAARRLQEANIACMVLEARSRLGGRAWTVPGPSGAPMDLGCEWLHSGDRNPWTGIAEAMGLAVDRTVAPWARRTKPINFPPDLQADYVKARKTFEARLEAAGDAAADVPLSSLVERGCRWTPLMDAVSTYISGAEFDRVSARDLFLYHDTGVNWRLAGGYGAAIVAYGKDVPAMLGCAVQKIDHGGKHLRIETSRGTVHADSAIVTLPSNILAEQTGLFSPALPDKAAAAAGLPLGLADKLFLSLGNAEEFEPEMRVFGRIDRAATGTYHFRPFGRPIIEAYYGGRNAEALEQGGEAAFLDFAVQELTGVFGAAFAKRVRPVHATSWGADPFARGSYSYAKPGMADCRQTLAAPVDERLFFAGEACSKHDYSTAHGAYRTGIAAAEQVIAARASAGKPA